MNVNSFYGARTRGISRHIISTTVPDDGNISDIGDVSDDDQSDDSDGDTLYQLADSDGSSGSESDVADTDSEDNDQMCDDWTEVCSSSGQPPPLARGSGPFIVLAPQASPIDFFNLLFPQSLWSSLVTETNRYAQSKPSHQEDTNEAEMKAFIGITLAMAIHKLPQLRNYWSEHWVLGVPQYRQIFPRNRYCYLFSNIHLVDNAQCLPRDDPLHDRLFKVRPLISKLNETFGEHYSPSRNVSVDESMVRFKGRSTLKQYLPMKPIKRGFKVWCLSCSCCGYLLQFQVYTGKEADAEQQNIGLAHRVVTDLLCPLYTKCNYVVYMDNFFTSLPLFHELKQNGIFACGTYRTNRTGFPPELSNADGQVKQMKRGDTLFRHKSDTTAVVWMDRKPVHVVSNFHPPTMTVVRRKNRDGTISTVSCPDIIDSYNRHMGGVDFTDQLKVYYGYNRKSKRWWLRLFFHFIDIAVVNAYILYLHCYRESFHPPLKYIPKKQLAFRCELVDDLVNHYTCRKLKGPVTTPVVSLTPAGHKIVDMRSVGVRPGRCEFCTVGPYKTKKRKETQFGCPKCQKRLCPAECWAKYHNKLQPQ